MGGYPQKVYREWEATHIQAGLAPERKNFVNYVLLQLGDGLGHDGHWYSRRLRRPYPSQSFPVR